MVMENRLPITEGLNPVVVGDDAKLMKWCKDNGIPVYELSSPDWHNDATPLEYAPAMFSVGVAWGAFWFVAGGWLGFLLAMWIES